jgi:hypothetical protein
MGSTAATKTCGLVERQGSARTGGKRAARAVVAAGEVRCQHAISPLGEGSPLVGVGGHPGPGAAALAGIPGRPNRRGMMSALMRNPCLDRAHGSSRST